MGLELYPVVGGRVVLPHIILRLGRPAAEKDGATVDGVKGGTDPAPGSPCGISSLSPGRRPALAFGRGSHEEERSQPDREGDEEEASQDSA